MYSLERCGICKGGHSTQKHQIAVKMANHNIKADKQNWDSREKRLHESLKERK